MTAHTHGNFIVLPSCETVRLWHDDLAFYIVLNYPEDELTSLCPFLAMLIAWLGSHKY